MGNKRKGPGLRRALFVAEVEFRLFELVFELGRDRAAHRAVAAPKVRVAVESIVARAELVEDVVDEERDGGFVGDLLAGVYIPKEVRRDSAGFLPVWHAAGA